LVDFVRKTLEAARLVANGEAKKATPQTKSLIRNATLFLAGPRSCREVTAIRAK